MSADFIGWRDCPLQHELGPRGLLQALRMREYRDAIEAQVPPEKRATVKITLLVDGRRQDLDHREICRQAEWVDRGVPECAACPLSPGRTVGCHRQVGYPVDRVFEGMLFGLFCRQLQTPNDAHHDVARRLYREAVSPVPHSGTAWHLQRGSGPEQDARAELEVALTHDWQEAGEPQTVDSAQLLAALFAPLDEPASPDGLRLIIDFDAHVRDTFDEVMDRHALQVAADGRVEPRDAVQRGDFAEGIARLQVLAESRTLAQIGRVAELLRELEQGGWRLVLDA